MSHRFGSGMLVSLVALVAACAAMMFPLSSEFRKGDVDATWSVIVIVPYAIFSIAWVARFEGFAASIRTALITTCVAVCTLLPRAMTGRLGAISLPVIVFGPSLPFVVAWRVARLTETLADASATEPSPTLAALLRGKRLRAAAAGPHRIPPQKPRAVRGQFDEPLL